MTVPHRVQNLSLGSASFPHEEHVQPVRRKREIRELIRSPPAWGPDTPDAGAEGGATEGGTTEGGGTDGGGTDGGGGWGTGSGAAAAARLAS